MNDDPVVFADRDRTSLVVGVLFGLVFSGWPPGRRRMTRGPFRDSRNTSSDPLEEGKMVAAALAKFGQRFQRLVTVRTQLSYGDSCWPYRIMCSSCPG